MEVLLFIIIAVISLIFNRNKIKPNNRQPDHPLSPRPVANPFDELEDPEEEQRPLPQTIKKMEEAKSLKDAVDILIHTNKQPTVAEQTEEIQNNIEKLKKEEETYRQKAQTIMNKIEQNNKNPKHVGSFNSNDIVNGLIMSEVLGKPRALKPYQRSSR